ncbi:tripartite tricarboxylate transporter substrate binding protein [Arsenicitalea aurantiaca]|uniref:tripartite tricarboxylate transporter substrate binding protein n=1 Tax=Arsenicitalea aurantiaca TaxID=1783274 RepID=UPI00131560A6|nr:tripartite tricarboxylate transporter substrate binding protein [Arsenicitalea aurantiaca]
MNLKTLALAAFAAAIVGGPALAQDGGWTPNRNVELVVPYSAGGGSDLNARALAEAIRQNNLVSRNIVVLNRPGGSGAVGNTYVASRVGDGTAMMTFNSGQMMSTLSNDAAVKLENITPLGTLALDTLMLAVQADAPYEDFDAFLEAGTANPQSITIGGAARGGEDNLVFAILDTPTGNALQYVPFDGAGDIVSALLGGHVTAGIFNPGEISAQLEAGSVRILGTFSTERLGGIFADIPTFTEQGYPDAVFEMFRGYAGPPGMTDEMIAYWDNVLGQVAETAEWQADVEANSLIPTYMNAADSKAFWEQEEERYIVLLTDLGFIN